MMPTATRPTAMATRIGPLSRLPATLTGVTGLRPFGPLPGVFLAAPGLVAPEAGGLPWPDVLPTLTVDGTRSGPGVLMLIVPRRFISEERAGRARVAAERPSLPPIPWRGDSR